MMPMAHFHLEAIDFELYFMSCCSVGAGTGPSEWNIAQSLRTSMIMVQDYYNQQYHSFLEEKSWCFEGKIRTTTFD